MLDNYNLTIDSLKPHEQSIDKMKVKKDTILINFNMINIIVGLIKYID